MDPIVRLYETEESAREAVGALEEEGFSEDGIVLVTPPKSPGKEPETVRAAIEQGLLPGSHVHVCTLGLKAGRSIVAVAAPFGRGQLATRILEASGPVESERLPAYLHRRPTPFSDYLGIPVLSSGSGPPVEPSKTNRYTFPSWLGLGLLTKSQAPTLGGNQLTSPKRRWERSFGLPLLSENPAPLSSMFRIKTLTSPKQKDRSFGMSLLSRNPTPLSSTFGLRVLSKDEDRD